MSAQLTFEIYNQLITRTDNYQPVAKSQNFLRAAFTFESDWGNADKIAIFQAGRKTYEVILDDNNECAVPWEVLTHSGNFFVSVYSGDRITATKVPVLVLPTGYTDKVDTPQDPSVDVYSALIGRMDSIDEHIEESVEEAVEKIAAPTKTSELINDSGFITSDDVPTKTSELTNDSGFVTEEDVPSKTSDLTNDSGFITTADVPKKTSELINDSGFITADALPTATSDLTNDSGFITAADVVFPIDDTAGSGDTDATWSADKIASELENAGSVKDVKINGTSIVDSETGEAEIPIGDGALGVVKVGAAAYGIGIRTDGTLKTIPASSTDIKGGIRACQIIEPAHQHESTFYGLAKAAGDTTQSQSSNAVGTYTDDAKAAIKNMLGVIDPESKVVTVTGTDPVIQAEENTRYMCGEVLSLSFTPSASGICEVIFTAGSTLPVITLPETVKMPEWFEIETDHTYDISIVDGVYGAVMVW